MPSCSAAAPIPHEVSRRSCTMYPQPWDGGSKPPPYIFLAQKSPHGFPCGDFHVYCLFAEFDVPACEVLLQAELVCLRDIAVAVAVGGIQIDFNIPACKVFLQTQKVGF